MRQKAAAFGTRLGTVSQLFSGDLVENQECLDVSTGAARFFNAGKRNEPCQECPCQAFRDVPLKMRTLYTALLSLLKVAVRFAPGPKRVMTTRTRKKRAPRANGFDGEKVARESRQMFTLKQIRRAVMLIHRQTPSWRRDARRFLDLRIQQNGGTDI